MDREHLLEIAESLRLFLEEFERLHGVKLEVYNLCCGGPGTIAMDHPEGGYVDVMELE